jgi:Fur family peroxide stress response transcriptional regulator
MTESNHRFENLLARFREQEYRITPQRRALLKLLSVSEEHPSAAEIHEQLHERFPTMSLATVYKTLNLLKEMGEVLELGFGEDENRYDGKDPYPHPHLICVRCHKIIDQDMPEFDALAQKVATNSGFRMTSHRLDVFGICPACQCRELEASVSKKSL